MAIELDPLAGEGGGDESKRLAQFWKSQIDSVKDYSVNKRWVKRGRDVENRYRDERKRVDEDGQRRYNALWSNVEILFPALYGKVPIPIAERRFRDKDPVGRFAAQMLERALRNEIEICGFDSAISKAVHDYLLPGRGTVWVRYEPEIEEGVSISDEGEIDMRDSQGAIKDDTEESEDSEDSEGENDQPDQGENEIDETPEEAEATEKLESTGDRIVRETTPVDHVNWEDFMTFPARARVWEEVAAVCRRVYLTKEQKTGRFGKKIAKAIPMQKGDRDGKRQSDSSALDESEEYKSEVYEIWSKIDGCVYWVAEGYEYLCDRKEDPLKLENFFPCPRPLYANATNNTLYPVPDFIQYQDQAIQIDELTQRISMLAKACKVAGVYNAAAKDIIRLFDESVENQLIPVDSWAAFAEEGGVAGNISFLPLKEIMEVIDKLMKVKADQILEMDRLTGITDIMRGTTDARETLGGQRLKTNTAGTRLQRRQNEVARFARDTVRIMADIISQHFSAKSIIEASGALYEEGLGLSDMPSMTSLSTPSPVPLGSPPTMALGQTGPVGAQGGATPQPPTGPSLSPPTPGTGMVPFGQPQGGLPAPAQPQGAPLNGTVMPPQGQPDPAEMERFKALSRIAKGIQLLRDERQRGFRVDIEVDSTIYGDQAQEKGDRAQFIQSVTQYLQQAMMMSGQVPQIAPLLGKFLQFGVRGFKVGRDLETAIEDFCDEAMAIAQQHQAQAAAQPNPLAIKAEAEKARAQTAAQVGAIKGQADIAKAQADIKSTQIKSETEARSAQAEVQRQQIENQGEAANAQADVQQKNADLEMKKLELQIEHMRLQVEMAKLNRVQKPKGEENQAIL